MKKNKPAGIVLISIYSALSGLLTFSVGSVMLLASAVPEMPAWVVLLGIICVVLGVFLLTAVYGLWSVQPWGLKITKWLYVISIPLGVVSIFPVYPGSEMTSGNTILQIAGIGLAMIIIYYLSKPKVVTLYQGE
jgi:DMSO reductase anchor subunit